ncbi:carbohydrate binding domain-containing protein [Flavobacteriaceae bacterium]|nr:carbohydrate binding domain-containing protein [Flavobacteriaceae bacterium]MDC1472086.1 carbohydrate binding domain-containing protein [Flavobacteriaceae bacterium]MDC1539746.1 carbohydrate binding domain-containing protein [Flavobacteriaceae bacterium]
MKKITLLLSLLMTSIGFSQTELLTNGDFSNGDASWALTGGSVVSGEAAFATTASAGDPWGTQLVQGSLAFTNAQEYTISFDARVDAARNITLAIQNVGVWTDQFRENFSLTTTMTTYTKTFNATSSNTNVQIGFLMGGFGVTDGVYYDNVSLTTNAPASCSDGIQNQDETGVDCGGSTCDPCPSPPTVAAPTPTHPSADVISLFSDAYTDEASSTNPGWNEAVTAETHASNAVLKTTNFLPFAITTPIDVTDHTLHVDVWLPELPSAGAGLLIKILDAANGPNEGNSIYPIANITAGQWNSIDIDISNFSQAQGTWDATAQGRVDQVLVDIVDDTTMYVDNLYFWKAPTAGVDDFFANAVKLHPNPAYGVVNISTPTNAVLEVSVHDLLGKLVIPVQTIQSQLNISSLNPGMYFVNMKQGTNTATKKLLVN